MPVVLIPFGLIEWRDHHQPLGNDAPKPHAFLLKCAEKFGGVVYPPVYFADNFDKGAQKHLLAVVSTLFERLRATEFRVIIGVSGHNVQGRST